MFVGISRRFIIPGFLNGGAKWTSQPSAVWHNHHVPKAKGNLQQAPVIVACDGCGKILIEDQTFDAWRLLEKMTGMMHDKDRPFLPVKRT